MNSRERITAAFRREEPDRVPVRLAIPLEADAWLETMCKNFPLKKGLYKKIVDAALSMSDLLDSWPLEKETGFFYTVHPDVYYNEYTRPSDHEGYEEHIEELVIGSNKLEGIELRSPIGLPSYRIKYMVTSLEEAKVFLTIPYERPQPKIEKYFEMVKKMEDRGVVLVGMVDSVYVLHEMLGPERLAFWSVDHRDILREMLEMVNTRQIDMVKYCISKGATSFYGWVGPEICLPPLMSPGDFSEFVVEYDRRMIDLIHGAGGLVWVHSHGRMKGILEKFLEMGVDCLNPLEPPPLGDISLGEAKSIVGNRMCLEGNIQPQEFLNYSKEQIRLRVREAIQDAGNGGGFILCPCSSMIEPLDEDVVENLIEYFEAAHEYGRYPLKK